MGYASEGHSGYFWLLTMDLNPTFCCCCCCWILYSQFLSGFACFPLLHGSKESSVSFRHIYPLYGSHSFSARMGSSLLFCLPRTSPSLFNRTLVEGFDCLLSQFHSSQEQKQFAAATVKFSYKGAGTPLFQIFFSLPGISEHFYQYLG